MPKYTAVLFTNPDGSHTARVPAVAACQARGVTRGDALHNVTAAAARRLEEIAGAGQPLPREERSPVRTVHVLDPRHGNTIPYVVVIEPAEDSGFQAVPVLFPGVRETAPTAEQALERIGPLLYLHLVNLIAQGKGFPTQDDPHAYVIIVPEPER